MKVDRKDLIPLLGLDFSKYEYYIDYLPYRQAKKTEYFDRDDLAWKDIDFDARAKWNKPFEFDIAKVSEDNKDIFVDMVLAYVNKK